MSRIKIKYFPEPHKLLSRHIEMIFMKIYLHLKKNSIFAV